MNDLARQYGYTDDEILEIHRAAAAVSGYGQSQHQNFNTLVQIGRPAITRTPRLQEHAKEPINDK